MRSDEQYRREFYGSFLLPGSESLPYILAEEYHRRCDLYDNAVCSGVSPYTGEPIPLTARELGLVNSHARAAIEDLLKNNLITRKVLWEAIRVISDRGE